MREASSSHLKIVQTLDPTLDSIFAQTIANSMKEFTECSWILNFFFSGEDEESVEDSERAKLLAEKLREMIREGNF